jgi:signal transduction histidine kinase
VQEALSNVHRHSNARHATVRLSQGRAVSHVVVADDGIGISNETLSGKGSAGVGLAGMGLRLSEIGGRLSVRHLNPGTAIIASVPSDRVRTPEKNEGAQPTATAEPGAWHP